MLSAKEKKERDRLERLQRVEDIISPFPVDTLRRVINGELGDQWKEYYPFILEHIKLKENGEELRPDRIDKKHANGELNTNEGQMDSL